MLENFFNQLSDNFQKTQSYFIDEGHHAKLTSCIECSLKKFN